MRPRKPGAAGSTLRTVSMVPPESRVVITRLRLGRVGPCGRLLVRREPGRAKLGWGPAVTITAEEAAMYARIVVDPGILGGKPIVKGTRISVEFLLELFASGATRNDILKAYPHLTADDIEEALRYAAEALKYDQVIPLAGQRA